MRMMIGVCPRAPRRRRRTKNFLFVGNVTAGENLPGLYSLIATCGTVQACARSRSLYSHLSLAFAASTVCHCMLDGSSRPPLFSALMWSTTYPGHAP